MIRYFKMSKQSKFKCGQSYYILKRSNILSMGKGKFSLNKPYMSNTHLRKLQAESEIALKECRGVSQLIVCSMLTLKFHRFVNCQFFNVQFFVVVDPRTAPKAQLHWSLGRVDRQVHQMSQQTAGNGFQAPQKLHSRSGTD